MNSGDLSDILQHIRALTRYRTKPIIAPLKGLYVSEIIEDLRVREVFTTLFHSFAGRYKAFQSQTVDISDVAGAVES